MSYDYSKSEEDRKNLVNLLKKNKVLERVTLKNVKTDIGHDLGGYFVDFYLDGKKMGYVNNDGWGGEVDPTYLTDAAQKTFEKFLIDNNVAQLMFDNGWAFFGKVEKIDLNCQAVSVVEMAIGLIDEKKFFKKAMKATDHAIVFGTDTSYRTLKFKIPLKAVILHKNGLEILQREYDKIKSELKAGEKIFNTNLEELGVKI